MTQGGKPRRDAVTEVPQPSGFAPLRSFAATHVEDLDAGMRNLSAELAGLDVPLQLTIELLDGGEVRHWDFKCGRYGAKSAKGAANVRVVMKRETWLRIAQGLLNPFDAFAAGKLLVGGDTEAGKRIVRQLTDDRIPFVSPC